MTPKKATVKYTMENRPNTKGKKMRIDNMTNIMDTITRVNFSPFTIAKVLAPQVTSPLKSSKSFNISLPKWKKKERAAGTRDSL